MIPTLAAAHCFESVRGRKMRHMQARAGNPLRKIHIPVNHAGLGDARHGAQTKTETGTTFMHGTVFGEARIFGVLHDGQVQVSSQQQSPAHDLIIENGFAIVSHAHCPGSPQGGEVGERGPATGAGGGGDGKHVHHCSSLRLSLPGDPLGCIYHRSGVGHGAN